MGGVYSIRCVKCGDLITKNNHSSRSCRVHEDIYERENLDYCNDCHTHVGNSSCNCYHRTIKTKKKFKNFGSTSL